MNNNIPSWLDPNTEIKDANINKKFILLPKKDKAIAFVLYNFKILHELNLGLNAKQILCITSNSISEVGWEFKYKANNIGGHKITKNYVEEFKLKYNKSPLWWKSEGHINSGDDPIVYYRGYDSIKSFYIEWCEKFIPITDNKKHRYYQAGEEFWFFTNENWKPENWFKEIIKAGYKGPITQKNPDKSIEAFKQINKRIGKIFCQYELGLDYDGEWGNKSINATKKFGNNSNGEFNYELFEKLFDNWIKQGMKQLIDWDNI